MPITLRQPFASSSRDVDPNEPEHQAGNARPDPPSATVIAKLVPDDQRDNQSDGPDSCADLHGAHRIDIERCDLALFIWHGCDDRRREASRHAGVRRGAAA